MQIAQSKNRRIVARCSHQAKVESRLGNEWKYLVAIHSRAGVEQSGADVVENNAAHDLARLLCIGRLGDSASLRSPRVLIAASLGIDAICRNAAGTGPASG
jgi:hypothetical protein